MAYTLDTPLGKILDDPRARTVIDRYIPGASTNPMMGMFRETTINILLSMPQASHMGVSRQQAEVLLAEINKLSA
jgi:hypothetical protein